MKSAQENTLGKITFTFRVFLFIAILALTSDITYAFTSGWMLRAEATHPPPPKHITIGPGPQIGSTAGQTFFEEFQDWSIADCRALDEPDDTYDFNDGYDTSRDIIAFYSHDDAERDSYFFRVHFLELGIYAENQNLDVFCLIDFNSPASGQEWLPSFTDCKTDHKWEVAIVLNDTNTYTVFDREWNVLASPTTNPENFLGVYYRSDLDSVEFGIKRSVLTGQGWDGTSTLNFQVATAKDGTNGGAGEISGGFGDTSDLTDAIVDDDRGFFNGFLNGAIPSTVHSKSIRYSFIIHGNQAISCASAIQGLIYNDTIKTPNGNPTGYHRVLDTCEIFGACPNIHVSATLVASALWADRPGTSDPQDGAEFVKRIAKFLDGNPANGEGALIPGVYSEHIVPYFEGEANRASIALNEDFLRAVFGRTFPQANSVFWIPERVVRGTTFADLTATGYHYTVLDQINHLRTWFGQDAADNAGFKISRINGVNCFFINDRADRFKFANSDGGLYFDTRLLLLDKALSDDQQQLVLVFDDWEAYAGRSFTLFQQGSDNPDNFNTNIRWLANHQWIRIVTLEDVAALGWTPIERGTDNALPIETYDWLDHATEDSYDHWHYGSDLEEDFDDAYPPIRSDLSQNGNKKIGAIWQSGTVFGDVWSGTKNAPGSLGTLARTAFSCAAFETAWHNEDNNERCEDGTFCIPDTTWDAIADFSRLLQFHNMRCVNIITAAANWTASSPAAQTQRAAIDLDEDGENEYVLSNNRILAVFENDGGRLIALFVRNLSTQDTACVAGNLLCFPDYDDERESNLNDNARRRSSLVDWWAAGPDTNQYVNDVYSVELMEHGIRLRSSDLKITKEVTLADGSNSLEVSYSVDASITTLYIRFGLSPDIATLLVRGQDVLSTGVNGSRFTLTNTATNTSISLDYKGTGHNAAYNAAATDGTVNTPRNIPQTHTVELSGSGSFKFSLIATTA